jgi:hypothetical protein
MRKQEKETNLIINKNYYSMLYLNKFMPDQQKDQLHQDLKSLKEQNLMPGNQLGK